MQCPSCGVHEGAAHQVTCPTDYEKYEAKQQPMNLTQFREFTEASTKRRHDMMFEVKQRAYTGKFKEQVDCLGNFKRRAIELQMTTKKVIESDLSKHWDQIRHGDVTAESAESLDSRFDDIQNYIDLLRAAYHDNV